MACFEVGPGRLEAKQLLVLAKYREDGDIPILAGRGVGGIVDGGDLGQSGADKVAQNSEECEDGTGVMGPVIRHEGHRPVCGNLFLPVVDDSWVDGDWLLSIVHALWLLGI